MSSSSSEANVSIAGIQWADIFFTCIDGLYRCNCCSATENQDKKIKTKLYKANSGCSNLRQHIISQHECQHQSIARNYFIQQARLINGNTLDNYNSSFTKFVSKKAKDIFAWLDLVIFADLPFSIVENKRFRDMTSNNVSPISRNTFTKYFLRTGFLVTEKPPIFCLPRLGLYSMVGNFEPVFNSSV